MADPRESRPAPVDEEDPTKKGDETQKPSKETGATEEAKNEQKPQRWFTWVFKSMFQAIWWAAKAFSQGFILGLWQSPIVDLAMVYCMACATSGSSAIKGGVAKLSELAGGQNRQ